MYIDYDEYYSLKSYAERFVSDAEDVINIYFSRPTTLNLITLWEKRNNEAFLLPVAEEYHKRALAGFEFSLSELISRLNLKSVFIDNGDVMAHIDIYNDFVAFLTENGVNT